MEREKVLGLFGSKVRTGTGFKNLMGNFNPSVGDYIYTDNGYVFGHESVQGRLPIVAGMNRADGYGFWLCLGYVETKINYDTETVTSYLRNCRDVFFAIENDKIVKKKESNAITESLDGRMYDDFRSLFSRIYDKSGKKSEFYPFGKQDYKNQIDLNHYIFNGIGLKGEYSYKLEKTNYSYGYVDVYSSCFDDKFIYIVLNRGLYNGKSFVEKIIIDKNNNSNIEMLELNTIDSEEQFKQITNFAVKNVVFSDTLFSFSFLNNRDFSVDINGNLILNYGESEFFLNLNNIMKTMENLIKFSVGNKNEYRYYYWDDSSKSMIGMIMHDSNREEYYSDKLSYMNITDLLKSLLIANVGKDKFIFTLKQELAGFPIFLMKCEKDKDNNHTTTILDVYVTGRDGAFMTALTEGVKL